MQKEYKTKDMKASFSTKKASFSTKKEEVLPIFEKKQKWCFRHNGVLHKFDSESEAKQMYKSLN